MKNLKDKKILLGVCGGIAAYKSCELLRRLTDQGADVHVVLTSSAQQFVTPMTFQALSQNPVHTDIFSLSEESEMNHIKLADEADLIVIAPATADIIAKIACGLANDLLSTLILVTRASVFFAPSMNVNMWEKEIVQKNIQTLCSRGYHLIEPEEGALACGWEGKGRLAEVETILKAIQEGPSRHSITSKKKSLAGKSILINAGPTREYFDPVRFISNPSSGKMGFALAEEAKNRGAEVTLIAGPVELPTPSGVQRIDILSADEMYQSCLQAFSKADIFIATAAVGDYAPAIFASQKVKKSEKVLKIEMKPTTDILKKLSQNKKNGQLIVGFAAETQNLLQHAKEKLAKKNLDLIVANDVSKKGMGFGSDRNQVIMMDRKGNVEKLPQLSKHEVAKRVLNKVEKLL